MFRKIISGGQVGADRAGLDWALDNGFEIGGWCPKGRKALDGVIPAKYPLFETKTSDYPERTSANVAAADATLIFSTKMPLGRGSALTERLCVKHGKPHEVIVAINGEGNYLESAAQQVIDLVRKVKPETLNIAGTRDTDVVKVVRNVMDYALAQLRQPEKPAHPKPDDPKKFFDRLAPLGAVTVEDGKQTIIFHDATGMPIKLRQDRTNGSVWLATMELDRKLAERLAATLTRWVETGSFRQGS